MGWKSLKEKFSIKHIVSVDKGILYIGSALCHNLVEIDCSSGEILRDGFGNFLEQYYPELLESSCEERAQLISREDLFSNVSPVYAFIGGKILELNCEEFGFPNVTTCGVLMHDNAFFKTQKEALLYALSETSHLIELKKEKILRLETEIEEQRKSLALSLKSLEALKEGS